MGLLARTFVGAVLGGSAFVTACGHSGFDDLPASEQGLTNDGGGAKDAVAPADGGPILVDDSGTVIDGGVEPADASPFPDGSDVDGGGGAVDAGCSECGVYVSDEAGDDANAGTKTAPLKTIAAGISAAMASHQHDVNIAGGSYDDDITVEEGVSLHGSYVCNHKACPWTPPDPAATAAQNTTLITNRHSGGVNVPSNVTQATTLDHLSVTSHDNGPYVDNTGVFGSAAMTIYGAPTVTTCSMTAAASSGGPANAQRSVGLVIAGVGAEVSGCAISAFGGTLQSVGVLFATGATNVAGSVAKAMIHDNRIASGQASQSIGVLALSSTIDTHLVRNMITSGISTGADNGFSWGVMANSPLDIDGNQVNTTVPLLGSSPTCTSSAVFCGGIRTATTSARIANNFVSGASGPRSAGVFINGNQGIVTTTVVVDSNTIVGGGITDITGSDTAGSISAAIVFSNSAAGGSMAAVARVANNILMSGTNAARYGIYENPSSSPARSTTLNTNDFVLPANPSQLDAVYHVSNGPSGATTDIKSTDDLYMVPFPTLAPSKNFSAPPGLTNGFQIGSGSPCANAGSTSIDTPLNDIMPKARSVPDVGAFEAKR